MIAAAAAAAADDAPAAPAAAAAAAPGAGVRTLTVSFVLKETHFDSHHYEENDNHTEANHTSTRRRTSDAAFATAAIKQALHHLHYWRFFIHHFDQGPITEWTITLVINQRDEALFRRTIYDPVFGPTINHAWQAQRCGRSSWSPPTRSWAHRLVRAQAAAQRAAVAAGAPKHATALAAAALALAAAAQPQPHAAQPKPAPVDAAAQPAAALAAPAQPVAAAARSKRAAALAAAAVAPAVAPAPLDATASRLASHRRRRRRRPCFRRPCRRPQATQGAAAAAAARVAAAGPFLPGAAPLTYAQFALTETYFDSSHVTAEPGATIETSEVVTALRSVLGEEGYVIHDLAMTVQSTAPASGGGMHDRRRRSPTHRAHQHGLGRVHGLGRGRRVRHGRHARHQRDGRLAPQLVLFGQRHGHHRAHGHGECPSPPPLR